MIFNNFLGNDQSKPGAMAVAEVTAMIQEAVDERRTL